jgi:hypothetical protein
MLWRTVRDNQYSCGHGESALLLLRSAHVGIDRRCMRLPGVASAYQAMLAGHGYDTALQTSSCNHLAPTPTILLFFLCVHMMPSFKHSSYHLLGVSQCSTDLFPCDPSAAQPLLNTAVETYQVA